MILLLLPEDLADLGEAELAAVCVAFEATEEAAGELIMKLNEVDEAAVVVVAWLPLLFSSSAPAPALWALAAA